MWVQFLLFARFVEHELIVDKELETIEWKARESIQEKEAEEEQKATAASKQTTSEAKRVPTKRGQDIRLLEMGGVEPSAEHTHQLR